MAKKYFNVDLETSGDVTAVDVTASGNIVATGNVSADDVTATGNTNTVAINASGNITTSKDVSAVDITASGNMSAIDITASGNMSAVDVTSSGQLNTNKVSARTGDEVLITNDPDTDNAQKIGVVVNDSPETTAFLTLAEGDNEETGGGARFIYAGNAAYLGGVTAVNKGAIQAIDIVSFGENKKNILEFHKDGSQVKLNSTGAITLTGGTAGSGDVIVQGQFECAYSATVEDNLTVNGALTCGTLTGTGTQIKSTTDLILTCDSDDSDDGDTTSVIKFCRNSDNEMVASITQDGVLGCTAIEYPGEDIKIIEFSNTFAVDVNSPITFKEDVFINPELADATPSSLIDDCYKVVVHSGGSNPTHKLYRSNSNFTGLHLYIGSDEHTFQVGDVVGLTAGKLQYVGVNSTVAIGIIARASNEEVFQTSLGETEMPVDHTAYFTASVGDTRTSSCQGFNVCNENGDIQPGDLLVTSSTPGYLMKQDDDIIRSKTVGKAMEAVTFDANGQATGIYGYIYCG